MIVIDHKTISRINNAMDPMLGESN
jgi:hypothetical protein